MKIFLIVIIVVLSLGVILASGLYILETSSLKKLDVKARAQAEGDFVKLSAGFVHYKFEGRTSTTKPLIVLVHGFSTPSFVWQGIVPILNEAGYQTLRYDLFGRGWSDRPNIEYSAELYQSQLKELLTALKVKRKIILIGYSMGGAIAAHFVAQEDRDDIQALALIAPAGLDVNSSGAKVFTLPLIGDWLMAVRGREFMLAVMGAAENQGRAVPDIVERYKKQMEYDGYLTALLSTLRHFPIGTGAMTKFYERVGSKQIPTLTIFGRLDEVVPISSINKIKKFIPAGQIVINEKATHAITYSEPEFVSHALLDFFNAL